MQIMNINKLFKSIFIKFFNFNPKVNEYILKLYFKSVFYQKRHIKNFQWTNDIKLNILNEKEGLLKIEQLQFILSKNNINSIPLSRKYLYAALISTYKIPYHFLLFWDDLIVVREIFMDKLYEKEFPINEGDIILDIGASVGFFACKIAKLVGETGKIIAIEPNPNNFYYLKKNIKKNNLKNIIPLNIGVWSSKIDKNFICNKYLSSLFNLLNLSELNAQREVIQIKCDTIDNIVLNLGLEKIDLIKMDIEGAEIEAIKGVKTILANSRNLKLIIAAYHKDNTGVESYKLLAPYLTEKGFIISEKDLPFIFAHM